MTTTPSYVINHVDENDVTVDWFFGPGHARQKIAQLVLLLVGWFFLLLPVLISASAIVNRDNDAKGWWAYPEGFALWDLTIRCLGFLTAFFLVAFLVLHIVDRAAARRRDKRKTYDEQRLAQRLEIAADWYAEKFGPTALRLQQDRVQVEPYSDLETYELRGRYRSYGVS